jgi:hypothetical protein
MSRPPLGLGFGSLTTERAITTHAVIDQAGDVLARFIATGQCQHEDSVYCIDGSIYVKARSIGLPGENLILIARYAHGLTLIPQYISKFVQQNCKLSIADILAGHVCRLSPPDRRRARIVYPFEVESTEDICSPENVKSFHNVMKKMFSVFSGVPTLVDTLRILPEVTIYRPTVLGPSRPNFSMYLFDFITLASVLKENGIPSYVDRILLHDRKRSLFEYFSYTRQVRGLFMILRADRNVSRYLVFPNKKKLQELLAEVPNSLHVMPDLHRLDGGGEPLWLVDTSKPLGAILRMDTLIPFLKRRGIDPHTAAAFLAELASDRRVETLHIPDCNPKPVRIRPDITPRGTLVWTWICPLCKQKHSHAIHDRSDLTPPSEVRVCQSLEINYGQTIPVAGDPEELKSAMNKMLMLETISNE